MDQPVDVSGLVTFHAIGGGSGLGSQPEFAESYKLSNAALAAE